MRKIITCSIFVMLFSMFTGSVFAGKYEECDPFKGMKRLYGLCNAYQNAYNHDDQDAMDDIWANWNKWATDEDPVLPNSRDDVDDDNLPEPDFATACPCWAGLSIDNICDMGTPDFYPFSTGGGFLFLENFIVNPQEVNEFFASGSMCEHSEKVLGFEPVKTTISGLEPDPAATCMAEVEVMASSDFCDI